jgi:hypothetical protein
MAKNMAHALLLSRNTVGRKIHMKPCTDMKTQYFVNYAHSRSLSTLRSLRICMP